MSGLVSGSATAFILYDVAEAIDLSHVRTLVDARVRSLLTPKVTTPPYIQYQHPPVTIEGRAIGIDDVDGFRVRFKAFDYGVISVALTRDLPHSWDALLHESLQLHDNSVLSATAERLCRALLDRLTPALTHPRQEFLSEDYLVFGVIRPEGAPAADALLAERGIDIAQLLRGEREALSPQERDEVLRHRISYFATDLVVPAWHGAFIYDSEAGVQGGLELLEFANSQLLEFRYYDQLLDAELARIYAQMQGGGWGRTWFSRRYTRAARNVHALFIDVTELTDRTQNALKIVGDVYAARLFALAAARLGLDQWKGSVREKLRTLDAIYRFAVERTAMARGEFLELTIVLILLFELALFFMGIME